LMDRPLKIDIASARPEERQTPQRSSSWSSRPPRERFNRPPSFVQNKSPESLQRSPSEEDTTGENRPKLDLKPRSDPSPVVEPAASDAYKKSNKSNPFGDARPRDENYYLKKKEEERKQRGDQVTKATEPKESQHETKEKVSHNDTSPNHDANLDHDNSKTTPSPSPSPSSPPSSSAPMEPSRQSAGDRSRPPPPFKRGPRREDKPRRDWDFHDNRFRDDRPRREPPRQEDQFHREDRGPRKENFPKKDEKIKKEEKPREDRSKKDPEQIAKQPETARTSNIFDALREEDE